MRMSVPLSSRWVAKLWRRVCTVTRLASPDAAHAERQAACSTTGWIECSPSRLGNSHCMGCSTEAGQLQAAPRTTPGGQPHYSALAIMTALTLRSIFRLALRQTEGLIGSIIGLLGLLPRRSRSLHPEQTGRDVARIPATTFGNRAGAFARRQHRSETVRPGASGWSRSTARGRAGLGVNSTSVWKPALADHGGGTDHQQCR